MMVPIRSLLALSGSAVLVYASTNVDGLFTMLAFFADRSFRRFEVVLGQYLGAAMLFFVSVAASLGSRLFPADRVGWLGLIPVAIGLKKLVDLRAGSGTGKEAPPRRTGSAGGILAVALVCVGNGGDNIGAYTPQFALHSAAEIAVMGLVFALMTALWCLIAAWLVDHPALRGPIRTYGDRIVPCLLIAVGFLTLFQGGIFRI
jgi:cadmium resistance protein CadD (predicted permease)